MSVQVAVGMVATTIAGAEILVDEISDGSFSGTLLAAYRELKRGNWACAYVASVRDVRVATPADTEGLESGNYFGP